MADRLAGAAFLEALTSVRHSAWRWECQAVYREPSEQEPFRQFQQGEPVDLDFMSAWYAAITRQTAAGRTYQRVRMLTDPLTEYLKFELSFTEQNIAAGEDVRVMPQSRARELDLPGDDFWLLDDELVLLMHFGVDGLEYADVVTEVAAFREIRDRAWDNAEEFAVTF
jgi:hypothetical protein